MALINQGGRTRNIKPMHIGIRKICVYPSEKSKVSATALLIILSKKAIANADKK